MDGIGEYVLLERMIVYRREGHAFLRIHFVQFRHGVELDAYLQQGGQRWRIHHACVTTSGQAADLLQDWMDEADALGFVRTTKFKKQE